jgi:hypothetical protein
LHLADGDLVQPLQALALRQPHVDQFGIHGFEVGQHEELLDGGMVAHVAVEFGIRFAPEFRGQPEQGDIEQIGLVGVDDRRLRRGHGRRDEAFLDGIGVDAVVELGEGAVEVPGQREAAVLVLLEALEFLDEVELKRDSSLNSTIRAGAASRFALERSGLHPGE